MSTQPLQSTALADTQALHAFATSRDPQAFALLTQRYQGMVLATCQRIVGKTADAEDAAQETFLKLARSAHSVRGCVAAWLHACACGTARDRLRRESAHTRALHRAATTRPALAEAALWQDLEPALDEAMEQLDDQTRDAIIAHFLANRPQADIARDAGVSAGTISRRIEKGLESLATHLRSKGFASIALAPLAAALAFGGSSSPVSAAVSAGAAKAALAHAATTTTVPSAASGGNLTANSLTAQSLTAQSLTAKLSGKAIAWIAVAGFALAGGVGTFIALRSTAGAPSGSPTSLVSLDRPSARLAERPMIDLQSPGPFVGELLDIASTRVTFSIPKDWTGPLESMVLACLSSTQEGTETVSRVRVEKLEIDRADSPLPPVGTNATVRTSVRAGMLFATMSIDGAPEHIERFQGRLLKAQAPSPNTPDAGLIPLEQQGLWRSVPNWSLSLEPDAVSMVVNDFVVEKYRVISWTPTPTGARVETLCTANVMQVPMIGQRTALTILHSDATTTVLRHTLESGKSAEFPEPTSLDASPPNTSVRAYVFAKELP
jgi:RNA polymerase sigma factor (sigma-70 family)